MGLTLWSVGRVPLVSASARSSRGLPGRHLLGRVVAGATVCVAWMEESRAEGVVRTQLQPFTWVAFIRETRGQS